MVPRVHLVILGTFGPGDCDQDSQPSRIERAEEMFSLDVESFGMELMRSQRGNMSSSNAVLAERPPPVRSHGVRPEETDLSR